ncbi:DUF4348 domain-containing protein [Bacteroides sp. 51]|uniref:DUF4348 domain-containing protein n=1 Tax=Bacteroides sp. 51 TaxID=2302938 RepID=UPI0013D46FF8|nr:DUF4348 domain-containing protein [Bacteroides sp. 51]NDV80535.1 DUF4348 domain-containing protein [Bacteroides sp. 51]
MKAKNSLLSFLFFALLAGVSIFSFGKTYLGNDNTEVTEQSAGEDFETFLNKFTTSAAFQYSRVKFPLETPITLVTDNGNEKTFPFTKERWPLLNAESFRVERVVQEEGAVYIAHYVLDEANHKEYEAGYEESELDLRIIFKLIDGKWYVTDCYNAWYSFDLPVEEFQDTVAQVQEENKAFREEYP